MEEEPEKEILLVKVEDKQKVGMVLLIVGVGIQLLEDMLEMAEEDTAYYFDDMVVECILAVEGRGSSMLEVRLARVSQILTFWNNFCPKEKVVVFLSISSD